jgi:transposase
MSLRAEQLPDDIEALKELVLSQHQQAQQYKDQAEQHRQRIGYLEEQLRLLVHKRFGASSERNTDQLGLFNEAEAPVEETEANEPSIEVGTHTRRRGKRAPLPDVLPRVEVVHDLAEHEKVCPQDGHALHEIAREVSEQLDVIPAKVHVIRHVRIKYGCRCCEQTVKTAPMPPQPIPKSQASAGLLAHIAVSKYVDALPLYRQSAMWARVGVQLDRTTLANWMVKVGELLQPLINLLQERLLAGSLIRMDETTVQVLHEPGRAAEAKSYMWVRVGGDPPHRIILFDYEPTRHSETPKRLLAGFNGVLLTDGYEGYGAAVREHTLVHAGCWAHARRKFDEAVKARAKSKQAGGGKAGKGLATINKLYQIERGLKEASAPERHRARQSTAKPIVEELHAWLRASLPQVPPTSLTGKALHYLHGQWPKLVRYLENGNVPMDNNAAENAIRPFVLGRKNWLFANSQSGARSSAAIYSVIQTAKANGLEPFGYLKHVLTQLPKADSVEDIEALLPFDSAVNRAIA